MAQIKSYTDIEQSKVLAKILPLESADMYYPNRIDIKYQGALPIEFKRGNPLLSQEIAAWSLAALLGVIPKYINDNELGIYIRDNTFAIWYYKFRDSVNNSLPNIKMESAVDACVEMIIKLHELNKM